MAGHDYLKQVPQAEIKNIADKINTGPFGYDRNIIFMVRMRLGSILTRFGSRIRHAINPMPKKTIWKISLIGNSVIPLTLVRAAGIEMKRHKTNHPDNISP
jgi:hypothetical protein